LGHYGGRFRTRPFKNTGRVISPSGSLFGDLLPFLLHEDTFGVLSSVDGRRYGSKVIWIYASTVATDVIDYQSIRDWPFGVLIGNPMRAITLSPLPNTTISLRVKISMPNPAATLRNCVTSGNFDMDRDYCRPGFYSSGKHPLINSSLLDAKALANLFLG